MNENLVRHIRKFPSDDPEYDRKMIARLQAEDDELYADDEPEVKAAQVTMPAVTVDLPAHEHELPRHKHTRYAKKSHSHPVEPHSHPELLEHVAIVARMSEEKTIVLRDDDGKIASVVREDMKYRTVNRDADGRVRSISDWKDLPAKAAKAARKRFELDALDTFFEETS